MLALLQFPLWYSLLHRICPFATYFFVLFYCARIHCTPFISSYPPPHLRDCMQAAATLLTLWYGPRRQPDWLARPLHRQPRNVSCSKCLVRSVLIGFIRVLWVLIILMWHHINEERDDKSFMKVERVLWGWNSSALFPKSGCVGNSEMKSTLRLV
jgi:hypothetical protein